MERWLALFVFTITLSAHNSLWAFKISPQMTKDRSVLETLPIIGPKFQDEQYSPNLDHDTHESGVFYHNIPSELFMNINFTLKAGSLRDNLQRAADLYKWRMLWELRADYDVPVDFEVQDRKLPEVFAEALSHLPIKVVFYARNKVIRVLPMYDKRESEHGSKFAISQSYD